MTATLAASQAILKVRYPDGSLPKALYNKAKAFASMPKREDFTGELRVVALQNENPQGLSARYADALTSLQQGTYNRFQVPRVQMFGIARITGQARDAAKGNEGALVDLWTNEMDGVSREMLMDLEIYCLGNGSGVRAQVSASATIASATLLLRNVSDVARFRLGMRVQAVSTNTLSPTLRTGSAFITTIDRSAGTISSTGGNWSTQITGLTVNDYLVRAGDYASAGTAFVPMGIEGWIPGGSFPGTMFQLNRDSDPVRLAGQTYDAAGVPMEEALIEASALVAAQGGDQPTLAICHPRDVANFKKALGAKVMYTRSTVKGSAGGKAEVSFSAIDVEGDDGTISLLSTPMAARNRCLLISPNTWKFDSIGPAPKLLSGDGNDFLRVAADDAYEARFGVYGNQYTNSPYSNIVITNFGA